MRTLSIVGLALGLLACGASTPAPAPPPSPASPAGPAEPGSDWLVTLDDPGAEPRAAVRYPMTEAVRELRNTTSMSGEADGEPIGPMEIVDLVRARRVNQGVGWVMQLETEEDAPDASPLEPRGLALGGGMLASLGSLGFAVPVPDEPVGVGARWSFELKIRPEGGAEVVYAVRATLLEAGARPRVRAEGTVRSIVSRDPGISVEGEGTFAIDVTYDEGMEVVHALSRARIRLHVEGDGEVVDTDFTTETTSEAVEPGAP